MRCSIFEAFLVLVVCWHLRIVALILEGLACQTKLWFWVKMDMLWFSGWSLLCKIITCFYNILYCMCMSYFIHFLFVSYVYWLFSNLYSLVPLIMNDSTYFVWKLHARGFLLHAFFSIWFNIFLNFSIFHYSYLRLFPRIK